MTHANPNQFEELGSIKENVRHNEKAVDELRSDFKTFRNEVQAEFKAVRSELKSFQLQFYAGVLIILVAQAVLKFVV